MWSWLDCRVAGDQVRADAAVRARELVGPGGRVTPPRFDKPCCRMCNTCSQIKSQLKKRARTTV